ncbi:phage portal protein [Streptomyces sp. PmtG]
MARTLLGALLNRTGTATANLPVPLVGRAATYGAYMQRRDAEGQMRAMSAVGTLFAIVDRTSNATALVDWRLYRKAKSGRAEDRDEVTSHAALDLWNRPNPFMPRQEFVESSTQHYDLTGESWWVISRAAGFSLPLEMWPVRPDRIVPVPDRERFLKGYVYTSPDGEQIPLELDEVIQLRRPNPLDPYRGLSPVLSILPDLDTSRYAAEWSRAFFINSAQPGGIIEVPQALSDTEFDELRDRWNEQHRGVGNAHRVAILEHGKWVDRTISQRDMQFVELRGATADRVREAYGISKTAIGDFEDINRASALAAKAWFAEQMTIPRLERIKAALNHELLPMFGRAAEGLEFDYENPVPPDAETEGDHADREGRRRSTADRGGRVRPGCPRSVRPAGDPVRRARRGSGPGAPHQARHAGAAARADHPADARVRRTGEARPRGDHAPARALSCSAAAGRTGRGRADRRVAGRRLRAPRQGHRGRTALGRTDRRRRRHLPQLPRAGRPHLQEPRAGIQGLPRRRGLRPLRGCPVRQRVPLQGRQARPQGSRRMSRMPGLTLPANLAPIAARHREQADRLRAQLGVEARSWYRISNAADPDEAEVMLYDEIGGWFGATADQFIEDLKSVTSRNLRVRVNSPGGSVFEGIAIANALRSHPAAVTIQVDGIAASIASVIAMAGDRVVMAPQTMLMIHDASGLCMGTASDMEEMAELLDLISDNIADAYAARAGGTREQWRARMRSETWYLPEDAVDAGLADEAMPMPKKRGAEDEPEPGGPEEEPEMRRRYDLAAYGYTGPRRPEPPRLTPGPPRAHDAPEEPSPQLVVSLADLLGEEAVAALRAAVAAPAGPTASAGAASDDGDQQVTGDGDGSSGPAPGAQAATDPTAATIAPSPAAPADEWADIVAHLTAPDPDPWAALVAHLTEPTASHGAATDPA